MPDLVWFLLSVRPKKIKSKVLLRKLLKYNLNLKEIPNAATNCTQVNIMYGESKELQKRFLAHLIGRITDELLEHQCHQLSPSSGDSVEWGDESLLKWSWSHDQDGHRTHIR